MIWEITVKGCDRCKKWQFLWYWASHKKTFDKKLEKIPYDDILVELGDGVG